MGYGAFYVICPRASSQYVTPLIMKISITVFYIALAALRNSFSQVAEYTIYRRLFDIIDWFRASLQERSYAAQMDYGMR